MTSFFAVRRAVQDDSVDISRLWYALSLHHEHYHPYYGVKEDGMDLLAAHVRDLFDKGCVFFLATVEDRIVGFVSGFIVNRNPHLEILQVGKIDNFFVDNRNRSKGIGGALLEEIYRFFHLYGVRYVEISCDIKNSDALRLYERQEFVEQKIMLVKELL